MVSSSFDGLPRQRVVLSPCVGVCELRADGLCAGCGRTTAEIAAWPTMDDAARLRVMERLDARVEG
jgi:predicted Fe-S protein YdhL (DUF1289 family)